MDTFAPLTVLFVAGLLCLGSVISVELWIEPNGPVLEGSTVTINCRATGKHPLDIVRLVRVVDDVPYELTTNELLSSTFRDTGRYNILEYDQQGFVRLQISHVYGEDGGNIGCKLMSKEPSHDDKFIDLIINVAPRSVEWLYQVDDGVAVAASNGDHLRLRQNVATTLTCRATVERTDFRPDVVVTLGDRDITARTTINATRRRPTTDDGFARLPDWTVERQVRWDADVAGEFHDKNLTCIAVMNHFSPLRSSVFLAIAYRPRLSCEPVWSGRLGQTDYEISCTGRMNPEPLQVVWQWNSPTDDHVEIYNEIINKAELAEQYRSSLTSVGSGHFEFRLFIDEVKRNDFHEYKLTVANEVDSATVQFTLVEVFTTTARRPSTTRRPITTRNGQQHAPVHQSPNAAVSCCRLAYHFVNVLLSLAVLRCY